MKTISFKSIIWSSTALKLLTFFLENATQEFYEKQVKEKTKLSLGATNKYLKKLASENVLFLKKRGKMNFFQLNKGSPLIKHLKIAYNLSLPVVSLLKKVGKKLNVKLYLYGSVARGEDVEDSDWDLLVLGNKKLETLEKEIFEIRKKFRRRIKLTYFTRNEWINMSKKDPAFYEMVERDKIELI